MKHTQTTTCRVRHDYQLDEQDLEIMVRMYYNLPPDAELKWGLITQHGPGIRFQFSWAHEKEYPQEGSHA